MKQRDSLSILHNPKRLGEKHRNEKRVIKKPAEKRSADNKDEKYGGLYPIGRAAVRAGLSIKMLRYYEAIGLMPRASRTEGGYRLYSETDVHTLIFIRRARSLGFSIEEIGELLALWRNHRRTSAQVKHLALQHVEELERKIAELGAMRDALKHLALTCHGDERPDCPILDKLAQCEHCAEEPNR
jgi:Cu(I)-responsive transcriptional regulator